VNRWSVLYFIVYMILISCLYLNMLITIAYWSYRDNMIEQV